MTRPIVDGIRKLQQVRASDDERLDTEAPDSSSRRQSHDEPTLQQPAVGNPISHGQVIDLWRKLQPGDDASCSLEQLLRGSRVYAPPAPPKTQPTEEYKALMSRLRREEAQRAYERMVNPPPKIETFGDRFPTSAQAAFSQVNRPVKASDLGDDEVTLRDVHRQVMLIVNFLVSILGVAGTLWVTARWWSLPARVLLTLGGSLVVAVAEVAVYSSYVWRMDKAHHRQKAAEEVKQVVNTWIVGQDGSQTDAETVLLPGMESKADGTLRKRITAALSESEMSAEHKEG
ncbi:hypothetical protein UVI_02016070 [Ustilaginoidea virens]|nr:hypothetical protein UVI_02016070 [Ustilaginoidea virens]